MHKRHKRIFVLKETIYYRNWGKVLSLLEKDHERRDREKVYYFDISHIKKDFLPNVIITDGLREIRDGDGKIIGVQHCPRVYEIAKELNIKTISSGRFIWQRKIRNFLRKFKLG